MFVDKNEGKILVVDDDKELADNFVEYLTKWGYRSSLLIMGDIRK